ncbi:MAG: hypothetical protein A3D16_07710 [Rhodobacterales bacterium RIFCSPHIGHO2_02_FULL_62_130]|nr:MAG: hypothetical protein A3D16_07710 [Rhodobacterales bacterium RIFCSPHIGHO2_02_FULL_62_130]OHC57317.1 MAG: hypothetical protein A3E48_05590 [Rhodobacterales bacterium RIFCSPHIGHO2_12_FULL_62_75]
MDDEMAEETAAAGGEEQYTGPKAPSVKDKPSAQSAERSRARAKKSTGSHEGRISNALRIIAELLEYDNAYLPVFLRLEAELKLAEERRAALERAKSLLIHRH